VNDEFARRVKSMKRQLLFAALITLALSAGANAQSGTGMTGPGAGTGTGKPGQAGQGGTIDEGGMGGGSFGIVDLLKGGKGGITMTGCLQRADQSASGAGRAFVLDTVRPGSPSSAASVSGVSGAVGTTGVAAVTLTGKESDLQKHVGERVELRGKWDESGKGAPVNGSLFKVSSVKTAEGSCPTQR
jgi:hypothetical protein